MKYEAEQAKLVASRIKEDIPLISAHLMAIESLIEDSSKNGHFSLTYYFPEPIWEVSIDYIIEKLSFFGYKIKKLKEEKCRYIYDKNIKEGPFISEFNTIYYKYKVSTYYYSSGIVISWE